MFFMKAYSIDLRKRVLATYDSGKYSLNQIAEQFQVTTRWIQKLRQRRKQEGSIAPKPQNSGRKPVFKGKNLERLEQFIKAHPGAELWFLPPYSPDLNPIEKMWSKIKAILRTLKARTEKALINAIAKALEAVTASDAKGWFGSCGYQYTKT